jgi:hypothetical protein
MLWIPAFLDGWYLGPSLNKTDSQPLSLIRAQRIVANHLFVVPVGDAHL